MRVLRLIAFTMRQHARAAHWQAGAEFVGGDRLRARALSHARLRSMGAAALRAEIAELRVQGSGEDSAALGQADR